MPVVGTSAYNTAGQITSLVRSLLNDAAGNLFTDAVLLPYINAAYRKVQRALGNVQLRHISERRFAAGGGGGRRDRSIAAGFDYRRPPRRPNQLPTALPRAAETLGTRQRFERRFCRDDRSHRSRRIAFTASGRMSRRVGVARRRPLFSRRHARTCRFGCAIRKVIPTWWTPPVLCWCATRRRRLRISPRRWPRRRAALRKQSAGTPQAGDAHEDLLTRATQREQHSSRRRRPYSSRSNYVPFV